MRTAVTICLLICLTAAPPGPAAPAAPAARVAPTPPIAIIATNYPIPAGALFVATTGDDAAAGDQAHPLKTVRRAISRAPAGTTIVIRQGTYREALGSVTKRLTLQPYPNEQVWFKGSSVVPAAGFVADGNAWRLDNWNPAICQRESGDPVMFDGTRCVSPPSLVEAGNTVPTDPEMAFVDGTPQRQVATRAEVAAGTFFWDNVANRLYLGTAPSGRTVEIADKPRAISFYAGAEDSVVRGLGFLHYAPEPSERTGAAVIIAQARGVILEKNTIARSASGAVNLGLTNDQRVDGNLLIENGYTAAVVNKASNFTFTGNQVFGNNTEKLGLSAGTGAGVKMVRLRDSVIRDNVFSGNTGTGYWCDVGCNNVTIVRNVAENNTKHGLFYEISGRGLIASNLVTGNRLFGLKIAGANRVRVYNNTFAGNTQALQVAEDRRPEPSCIPTSTDDFNCVTPELAALGVTYNTADVTLVNNIYAGGTGTAALIDTLDANPTKKVNADDMIPAAQMDHNGYYRTAATTPATLVKWARISGDVLYPTLTGFRATGREANGRYQEGPAVYFVDPASGDYRLVPGSAAETAGKALPADVAAAIGLPATGPVPLGAPNWPGRPTTPPPPAVHKQIYRLKHPQNGDTLLTASATETTNAQQTYGYVLQSGFFIVSGTSATPVYRLWNGAAKDRQYATSAAERDSLVTAGYVDEGIKFYALSTSAATLVPVHRLKKGAQHLIAVGDTEKDAAIGQGWTYERVLFYARPG